MKLDELIPLAVQVYRRLEKEPGPKEELQTREFRKIVAELAANQMTLPSYLLYYMPLRYQEGLSLIGECPETPKRVLDLFSRTGPFALAALERGAREVIMLDPEEAWLDVGSEIIGKMGYPVQTAVWKGEGRIPVEGNFDLIIAAYPSTPLKDEFIHKLFSRLTPQGLVLLVDSSLEGINKEFLARRDRLVLAGFPVQAPCVWRGECVALKSQAPCYAQREYEKPPLLKELQRGAGINLSSLKMSYLLLRNKQAGWPEVEPSYRVISPPIDTMQGKRFFLCGTDGKKTLGTTLKIHPKPSRAYEYLKRGELIAIEKGSVNKNAIEIVEDTIVKVIAPLGKPLCPTQMKSSKELSTDLKSTPKTT